MNNKTLKCAVIGLGRIGWQFHIPQIVKNPGFELTAVVDPNHDRLAEAKTEFGAKHGFASCEELLASAKIDLAVITSPTQFHCPQAMLFLRNGVDVFCDKPLATSLDDATLMAETARSHGQKLMVFQPHRLSHEVLTARAVMESGKLGEIYMISRASCGYTRRNDWQAFSANGGGMLLNYGAHYIDQFLYLTGGGVASAKCELRRVATLGDADDVVKALISGQDGTLFDLTINQAAALSAPALTLYGRNGAGASGLDGFWTLRYFRPEELPPIEAQKGLAASGRKYPSENIRWIEEKFPVVSEEQDAYYWKCHEYYALNKEPFVPVEDTLEVMRAIEMCRKSGGGEAR